MPERKNDLRSVRSANPNAITAREVSDNAGATFCYKDLFGLFTPETCGTITPIAKDEASFYYAFLLPVVILQEMTDKTDQFDPENPKKYQNNPKMPLADIFREFMHQEIAWKPPADKSAITARKAAQNLFERLYRLTKEDDGIIAWIGYNKNADFRREIITSTKKSPLADVEEEDYVYFNEPRRTIYKRGDAEFTPKLEKAFSNCGDLYKKLENSEDRVFLFQYYCRLCSSLFDKNEHGYGLHIDDDYFNKVNQSLSVKTSELKINRNPFSEKISTLAYRIFLLVIYLIAKGADKPPENLMTAYSRMPSRCLPYATGGEHLLVSDYLAVLENYPAGSIERFSALQALYFQTNNCYAAHDLIAAYRLGGILHDASGERIYELRPNQDKARVLLDQVKGAKDCRRNEALFEFEEHMLRKSADSKPISPLEADAMRAACVTQTQRNEVKEKLLAVFNSKHRIFIPAVYYSIEQLIGSDEFKTVNKLARDAEYSSWFFDDVTLTDNPTPVLSGGGSLPELIGYLSERYTDEEQLKRILSAFPQEDLERAIEEAKRACMDAMKDNLFGKVEKMSRICMVAQEALRTAK